jgi:DNA invertase Pin-like site-specific DNA recombinase
MNKYVTYLRVSTDKQKRSGLGIEAQRAMVNDHIKANFGKLIIEVIEYESGRKVDAIARPILHKALRLLKDNPGAKLLLAKTDRIARDLHFISGLLKDNVPLIVAGHEHMTKLEWHMHAMIAEHEAEQISHRTKAALAQAKSRGVILGAPKALLPHIQKKGGKSTKAKSKSHREKMKDILIPLMKTHMKKNKVPDYEAIANHLNHLGIKTFRGIPFNKGAVYYLINRENLNNEKKY